METHKHTWVLYLSSMLFISVGIVSADSPYRLTALDIRRVKVEGEIGRRIDITVNNNILAADVDKDFLLPFKERNRRDGYIGLGKFIDSLARFAAYTNDERVLALKKQVVAETLRTQEPDGYIGLCVPESRMWALWDLHEMGYLILGLTTDYRYFGEKASLEGARRLADYIIGRWSEDPQRKTDGWISVYVATIGLEEAMLALHERTGEERYLNFCVDHRGLRDWNTELIEGRWGNIEGHAYYHLCRCLAQLRLHGVQPEADLMNQSHRTLDFLLREDGLLAPGICGYQECWHSNQQGFYKAGETCATAYLLRWLGALLQIEGKSICGDIMERSIYNGLFAAQSPDGRRLRYYAPFEGSREYYPGDTFCCPCNFRRIIAELPEMVYYRSDHGVVVNLYAQSSATVDIGDGVSLEISQQTDYPNSGDVVLHLNPSEPARFPVYLRIPGWCDSAEIVVDADNSKTTVKGGSFFAVTRRWKGGDAIRLHMPMPWRLIRGRKSQAGRVAVARGPMLLGLNPDRQEGLDPRELKLLRLDPYSLESGDRDQSIRPDGLTCRARVWPSGDYSTAGQASLKLTLTEYADPGCQWTYFLVPNPKVDILTDDELTIQTSAIRGM